MRKLEECYNYGDVDHIFYTYSDVGSIKIGNDDFSIMQSNFYGDCENEVYIIENQLDYNIYGDVYINSKPLSRFHFKVKKDNSCFLYDYDCGNEKIYTFKPGFWYGFAYEKKLILIKYF